MVIKHKKMLLLVLMMITTWGCGNNTDGGAAPDVLAVARDGSVLTDMATRGDRVENPARFAFDVVTFSNAGSSPQEVHINGLPVVELPGANKVSGDTWEAVTRQGVRFSAILSQANIAVPDDTPVNCVARDGFDPLRTKLAGDTSKLPTFVFLRDHGYVYVGSPGDKDPLYPEMEGKSLIVDYDVDSDGKVPASLGGKLSSLGMFRWKMIEKVDGRTRGIIELNPVSN